MSKISSDGNISFNIDDLVAKVIKTDEKQELFASTDHGEAEEKYTEAIMLRDLSGFSDAESIKKHLQ